MEPVVIVDRKTLLSDPGNLGFHVTSLACGLHSGDVILLEKAEIWMSRWEWMLDDYGLHPCDRAAQGVRGRGGYREDRSVFPAESVLILF